MRTAVLASPRPWNSGRTIQPISDIAALSSCDHSATEPATTPGALTSGMIILTHAVSAPPLDIAGDFRLHALAGQRAAEFGHHDRITAHPDVGIDIARFNIAQTHPAPPRPGVPASRRLGRDSRALPGDRGEKFGHRPCSRPARA